MALASTADTVEPSINFLLHQTKLTAFEQDRLVAYWFPEFDYRVPISPYRYIGE